ncbi:DUF3450 domain-containing protein [Hyphobacterium sp.]|uniref:DUF3450 domain-containing protein n=1 Tax=Hyphobacterium sp. TaxID=2004662 RepID=UPI003748E2B6
MANLNKWLRTSVAAAVFSVGVAGIADAQLQTALSTGAQSTQDGASTQSQIDSIDDDRTNAELEYRALLQQIESQRLYVAQQEVFIQSQQNELDSLRLQIDSVGNIQRDLIPMLREMVDNLRQFVELDLPFQHEARLERVDDLYELIDEPDVSAAEKYRVILNRYDIEASYGRGLRVYESTTVIDGADVTQAVLQIGRVALIRDTQGSLDMLYAGASDWVEVPSSYNNDVQRAFRIAREVTTPEVFTVPLPGSEDQ